MAINLATKNATAIASTFTNNSFIAGRTGNYFDFTGVKGLRVYTPITVPMVDYTRDGLSRYGSPMEMQDTVQEMVMSQDKGFALTIDKGNNEEQMGAKAAGQMLNLQISERVVPEVDKYALKIFVRDAGEINSITTKPTKTNIMEEIGKSAQKLDDAMVPTEDRYLAVSAEIYSLIRLAPEFIGVEALGQKALEKGAVGEVFGAQVIKVPTSYLPADCYFVMWHKSSVLVPNKISDAKVHTDPPGISGSLLEGRWLFDAFVVGARAKGVSVLVKESGRLAGANIAFASNIITITAAGADVIKYTTDGTDPRYSASALVYSAPVSLAGAVPGAYTVKAVAYKMDKFTAPIVESIITKA